MTAKSNAVTLDRELFEIVPPLIAATDLTAIAEALTSATTKQVNSLLERLSVEQRRSCTGCLKRPRH